MTSLPQAHLLVTLTGLLPTAVAYLQAKYYFRFAQRSVQQLLAVGLALVVMLGVIPLQVEILGWCGFSTPNEYLRKLTFFQYLFALIVFAWKLSDTYRKRTSLSKVLDAPSGPVK